jgi:hypothetical protein
MSNGNTLKYVKLIRTKRTKRSYPLSVFDQNKTNCLTTAFLEIFITSLSCVTCVSVSFLSCLGLSCTPKSCACIDASKEELQRNSTTS